MIRWLVAIIVFIVVFLYCTVGTPNPSKPDIWLRSRSARFFFASWGSTVELLKKNEGVIIDTTNGMGTATFCIKLKKA
jgi:hypothetical protein